MQCEYCGRFTDRIRKFEGHSLCLSHIDEFRHGKIKINGKYAKNPIMEKPEIEIKPKKTSKRQRFKKRRFIKKKNQYVFHNNSNLPRKRYYMAYIASKQWKSLRTTILKRDKYMCAVCSSKADHVHHWTYNQILGTEKDFLLSSVCKTCHDFIHKNEAYNISRKIKSKKRKVQIETINRTIECVSRDINTEEELNEMDRLYESIMETAI